MNRFPSVEELEVSILSGKEGIAIIVEGDTFTDDPFYYRKWFSTHTDNIAFFPQNGWVQVVKAVTTLRERNLGTPIYGIIDRDFCEEDELDRDFETLGILRTPRYTLENYLFDPQCWAAVFQLIFLRNPVAAKGWEQGDFVAQQINEAYQFCLGIAAHNWVVNKITPHYEAQPGFQSRTFLKPLQPNTDEASLAAALSDWQRQLEAKEDLQKMFQTRLQLLRERGAAFHETQVSGKHVLRFLYNKFSRLKPSFPPDVYLNLYLDKCSSPPPDLVALIDRILAHAHQPKGA